MVIIPLMKNPRQSSLNYNPATYVPRSPGALNTVPDMVREKVLHYPKRDEMLNNGTTND